MIKYCVSKVCIVFVISNLIADVLFVISNLLLVICYWSVINL